MDENGNVFVSEEIDREKLNESNFFLIYFLATEIGCVETLGSSFICHSEVATSSGTIIVRKWKYVM